MLLDLSDRRSHAPTVQLPVAVNKLIDSFILMIKNFLEIYSFKIYLFYSFISII